MIPIRNLYQGFLLIKNRRKKNRIKMIDPFTFMFVPEVERVRSVPE